MVFECSLKIFRLHSLRCCLTFRSLLREQTMERFFWGGPSKASTCFCGPIATERASSAQTVEAFKPFGYCILFSIFDLINCSPSAQRNQSRDERSYLYQVQLELGVCTLRMHYMDADKSRMLQNTATAILMFCDMLCSGELFDPAHQHLIWSDYKIQQFLVCHYHLSCHHGAQLRAVKQLWPLSIPGYHSCNFLEGKDGISHGAFLSLTWQKFYSKILTIGLNSVHC